MANIPGFDELWLELNATFNSRDQRQIEDWARRVRELADKQELGAVPDGVVKAFVLKMGPYMTPEQAVALLAL